jgi:hypothetical protein
LGGWGGGWAERNQRKRRQSSSIKHCCGSSFILPREASASSPHLADVEEVARGDLHSVSHLRLNGPGSPRLANGLQTAQLRAVRRERGRSFTLCSDDNAPAARLLRLLLTCISLSWKRLSVKSYSPRTLYRTASDACAGQSGKGNGDVCRMLKKTAAADLVTSSP